MQNTYNLLKEPTGNAYSELITFALEHCTSFIFVIRHSIPLDDSSAKIINKLQPFLIQKTEKSEWPGTKLLNGTATVFQYKLTTETASLLINFVKNIFSWIQPDFPEDLSFIRENGNPWLVTISHEKDAYFLLSHKEKEELHLQIPELVLQEKEKT
jgi:hypothetical protein